ncbi:hypothetical protein GHT09_000736 [Marmota monax]|uniref:Uncharacterized protein n=1 Tax=Marmota monax TaxID=9995 RepID=A0A834QYP7_MARMO|nr:hypothetical protein GHT09_000736 [Marmota monax]
MSYYYDFPETKGTGQGRLVDETEPRVRVEGGPSVFIRGSFCNISGEKALYGGAGCVGCEEVRQEAGEEGRVGKGFLEEEMLELPQEDQVKRERHPDEYDSIFSRNANKFPAYAFGTVVVKGIVAIPMVRREAWSRMRLLSTFHAAPAGDQLGHHESNEKKQITRITHMPYTQSYMPLLGTRTRENQAFSENILDVYVFPTLRERWGEHIIIEDSVQGAGIMGFPPGPSGKLMKSPLARPPALSPLMCNCHSLPHIRSSWRLSEPPEPPVRRLRTHELLLYTLE